MMTGAGIATASFAGGAMLMSRGRGMASLSGYASSAAKAEKSAGALSAAAMRRYKSVGAIGLAGGMAAFSGIRDIQQGEYNKSKGKLAMTAIAGGVGAQMYMSGRGMSRNAKAMKGVADLYQKAGGFRKAGFVAGGIAAVSGAQALRKSDQGEYNTGLKYAGAAGVAGIGAGVAFRAAGSRAAEARRQAANVGQLRGLRLGSKAIMGLGMAAGAAAGGYAMYKHGVSVFAGSGG